MAEPYWLEVALEEDDADTMPCGLCEKYDRPGNLPCTFRGMHMHTKCMNGKRAHDRFIRDAPEKVRAEAELQSKDDLPAWRKRVMPWVEPDTTSRKAARVATTQLISFTEAEFKRSQKTISDKLRVTLVEFQAFESFWHRKSDEQAKQEFFVIHSKQGGQHDESVDGVTVQKILIDDIQRSRHSTGFADKERVVAQQEVVDEKETFEAKRKRLVAKTRLPRPSPSVDPGQPQVASGAAPSSSHVQNAGTACGDTGHDIDNGEDETSVPQTARPTETARSEDGVAVTPRSDAGSNSIGEKRSGPGKFRPRSGAHIDDETRERALPDSAKIEKFTPLQFMELKTLWASMAKHMVKGFVDPTNGYIKQLKNKSKGVGHAAEKDLSMPTQELIDKVQNLCETLEKDIESVETECTKTEFGKVGLKMDSIMRELEVQRKVVGTHLEGLGYLLSKGSHNKAVAYMTHYNKRTQISKRLSRNGFDNAYADNIAKLIYGSRGSEEMASLTEAGSSNRGKKKKPLPCQGNIKKNSEFDANEVGIWTNGEHHLFEMGKSYLSLTKDAIESKVQVHHDVVKSKGDSWLGCVGRITANPPQFDFSALGDGYHNLNKDPQGPWLCTMRPDKIRYGPPAFPLPGYECLAFPINRDMFFIIHPAHLLTSNGIAFQDLLNFLKTDAGLESLQQSYFVAAKVGDMVHIPFGMLAQPLYFPETTPDLKPGEIDLGHCLVLPLLHKGRMEALRMKSIYPSASSKPSVVELPILESTPHMHFCIAQVLAVF